MLTKNTTFSPTKIIYANSFGILRIVRIKRQTGLQNQNAAILILILCSNYILFELVGVPKVIHTVIADQEVSD